MPDPKPLRIVFLSAHGPPLRALGGSGNGGQHGYVDQVAWCLAASGHHVDVMTQCPSPDVPGSIELAPRLQRIQVDTGPACFVPDDAMPGCMPVFAEQVHRHMRQARPYDVIHANGFRSGWVGMQLAERFDVPVVATFDALGLARREHQGPDDGLPVERIEIERRLARKADRIVVECPQDEADLVRLYAAPRRHIRIVPHGVDLREFGGSSRGEARRELGLADDEFVVLQLGRIVPGDGIENVIRAVALLKQQSRIRLLVVDGDDGALPAVSTAAEVARLADIATEQGIANRITFFGHLQRHRAAACYAACDVFATTPSCDPSGIRPLEAMAASRPVVGSAVGGIRHAVVDASTGFLVPPNDPAALADRIDRLRAEPLLARTMGFAGRSRVMSCFTWERVATDLAQIYAEVVDRSLLARGRLPGLGAGADRPATASASASA